jgi:hypothetical protein
MATVVGIWLALSGVVPDGRRSDRLFVITGAVLMAAGTVIGVVAP